jgi:outer membrane protein insertion porin family
VEELTITGNQTFSRKEILRQLPSLRAKFLRSARYNEAGLQAELDVLRGAYRAVGFRRASVTLSRAEVDAERRRARLTIEIVEGPRTYVRSVAFDGNAVLPTPTLDEVVRLRPGNPFNADLLKADSYRIYALYADLGYTYAKVVVDSHTVADSIEIAYEIDENGIAYVGSIEIAGNARTLGKAIRRELLFEEGDPFRRDRVLESRSRLYRTGLFRQVTFETKGLEEESTYVDVVVRVSERQQRWIGIGVGYGTLDFFRVSGDWNHRNLFGSLIEGEFRVVASRLFSEQDNNVRADFTITEPWLFGTRTEGAASLFHEARDIENFEVLVGPRTGDVIGSYRLRETGLRLTASREVTRRVRATLGFNLTTAKPEDPSEPVDPELLGREVKRSFDFTAERNGRNRFFDPTEGSVIRGSVEWAGPVGGDSKFLRGRGAIAVYRPAIFGTTLAGRVEVGSIRTLSDSTGIPDHERFRLGGATTVRGYDEEEIGPGNFLMISNLEWRVPLVWKLSTVVFLDGGNTWGELDDVRGLDFRLTADSEDVGGGDVRYSAGTGLRLATPVGPARLDWGRRLKRGITPSGTIEDPWAIHLSLGQAF